MKLRHAASLWVKRLEGMRHHQLGRRAFPALWNRPAQLVIPLWDNREYLRV